MAVGQGESRADAFMRISSADYGLTGSLQDRQKQLLTLLCILSGKDTNGSVADLQQRLGFTVREIMVL